MGRFFPERMPRRESTALRFFSRLVFGAPDPDVMIRGKMAVAHVSHSGDEEGECSDDRDETSQNNRFASVFPDIIFVCTKRDVKIDVLY